MVNVNVVVCVKLPAVPFIMTVRDPVLDLLPTRIVMVEVPAPGAAIELGLNVTVLLLPAPEADRLIAELNPPEMVVVIVVVPVPEPLFDIVIDAGAAVMAKFGFVPVTFRETVVVAVTLPDVPFTVMT